MVLQQALISSYNDIGGVLTFSQAASYSGLAALNVGLQKPTLVSLQSLMQLWQGNLLQPAVLQDMECDLSTKYLTNLEQELANDLPSKHRVHRWRHHPKSAVRVGKRCRKIISHHWHSPALQCSNSLLIVVIQIILTLHVPKFIGRLLHHSSRRWKKSWRRTMRAGVYS